MNFSIISEIYHSLFRNNDFIFLRKEKGPEERSSSAVGASWLSLLTVQERERDFAASIEARRHRYRNYYTSYFFLSDYTELLRVARGR